jgi:histidine triad (HIT) family protein
MQDCLFCKIVNKEIKASVVFENDSIVAFLDINPVNPGHVLIVPREHSLDYVSTSDEILCEIAVVAKRVGEAIIQSLWAGGFNIGVNNGRLSGQLVDHMHLHVIPRFENDGYQLWHGKPYKEGEMEGVAKKLAAALS